MRDGKALATIPVGKRPRGLHASPEGAYLYVALSGSKITGPPQLDARGNPILKEDDDEESDHSADGIGVVDLGKLTLLRKLPSGSDPEEFAVSKDGKALYISNEDVATASVLDITSGKVAHIVRVKKEPEGVALSPDGKFVYVTCETGGEVVVIDTARNKAVAEIAIGGRPRTVAFLPDGSRAFIPSETEGTITVVDTATFKPLKYHQAAGGLAADGHALGRGEEAALCQHRPRRERSASLIPRPARSSRRYPWARGRGAWGWLPDGKTLFVANGPSNDVSVIDLDAEKEVAKLKAGDGPWGIAIVPMVR